ncbi:MAG: AAA family ATPase [Conexivisphaerales archaeon]
MIFKDRDKLLPTYIPKELPHREEQVDQLVKFYSSSFEGPEQASLKFYQIVGPVGSGKTVTVLTFGRKIEELSKQNGYDVRHVYVNPRQHGTSKLMLFRYIVQKVDTSIFSLSLSAEELMLELLKYLNRSGKYIILIFDEVDFYLSLGKEHLVYNLTRLNEVLPEQRCNVLGVVFTARNDSYLRRLDEAELSSLGRYYVEFSPYSASQIYNILEKRSYEAFLPNAIEEKVLRYVADIATSPPAAGDVRFALSILYNAGILAENRGRTKLSLDDIREVLSVLNPSVTEEDIMYLPEEEKFVLLSLANALKHSSNAYITFDELVSQCEVDRRLSNAKPFGLRDIVKYAQNLKNRGIIDIRSLTEIGISNVPAEGLQRFLDFLIKRLGDDR